MDKKYAIYAVLFAIFVSHAQEVAVPTDLRQHNLTEFNSSLFNPVFSLDRNNPQSIAWWSRYQWQTIDADPTSIFLNYSGKINEQSSIGAGFIQNNTGVFLNTGAVLNYAYAFNFDNNMQLSVGLNVFGFSSEIADDRYTPDPDILLPQLEVSNAFIMQFAPGVRFSVDGFSVGFTAENIFDYDFSTNNSYSESDEKIYLGMVDYQFPLTLFSGVDNAYLRPLLYVKSVPYGDTQVGLNALLSSNKFWVQGGYNSFYGISGGLGGRFFKHLSLGALIEYGTDAEIKNQDPSFELIAAYTWGSPDDPKKGVGLEVDEDEEALMKLEEENLLKEDENQKAEDLKLKEELTKAEALAEKNANKKSKKQKRVRGKKKKALAEELRLAQEMAEAKKLKEKQEAEAMAKAIQVKEEQRLDSVKNMELALAKKIQEDLDRIAARKKAGKSVTQGHYEEVDKIEGQKAGFYLIGNVYGTSRYRDIFIQNLKKKGIDAKFFYLAKTKWDYVYLERFDTLSDAEAARDNDFNGKYAEKTWIFRVIGE
ncbi:PorP/SprF family type IX secretion system membrane protein [Arenibacter sp. F26102]|uniref:PorP/SprF family type IX secretion system membrane protein n=1 Tax=Arenibacter sp. F26102 TaxID=2926416 RepID=UPI001FF44D6A|nr:PorP/SprF family type IX secretion system membrane protein [Arenibacter sp. F26102]MCK0147704.1 PorP/SprF family type IX secretion system membrane protein [Arenibacter sp. F26102]